MLRTDLWKPCQRARITLSYQTFALMHRTVSTRRSEGFNILLTSLKLMELTGAQLCVDRL